MPSLILCYVFIADEQDDDEPDSEIPTVVPNLTGLSLPPALSVNDRTTTTDPGPSNRAEDTFTITPGDIEFTTPPCDCKLFNGKPCHTQFNTADIITYQDNYNELIILFSDHYAIAIMAKIQCGLHSGDITPRHWVSDRLLPTNCIKNSDK